jgi:hypothetical protein
MLTQRIVYTTYINEMGCLETHRQDYGAKAATLHECLMMDDPFQNTIVPRRGESLIDYRRRRNMSGTEVSPTHHYLWIDGAWRKRAGKIEASPIV